MIEWNFNTILNIVMYLLLVIVTYQVYKLEQNDKYCNDPANPTNCNFVGMPYRGSTPIEGSSCQELLENIRQGAGAEQKSIKWRRSLVLSVIIMFVIWILVITPVKLPVWYTFYLTVIIGFVILYWSFNNYSYHLFKIPEDNIYKAIELLQKQGCVR